MLENPGIWQKKIVLVPQTSMTGDFTLRFPSNISAIRKLFDDIDKETKTTSLNRNLIINAYVAAGQERFIHSLPIKLGNNLVEVASDLRRQQLSGVSKFDYVIYLKPNSIFDTSTLQPPQAAETPSSVPTFDIAIQRPPVPETSPPVTQKPGQVVLAKLVSNMQVTFSYEFKADSPVNRLDTDVEIVATIEAPGFWSKAFSIMRGTKSGDFSITFPIDLASYARLLEAIQTETSVSPDSYNLAIVVSNGP